MITTIIRNCIEKELHPNQIDLDSDTIPCKMDIFFTGIPYYRIFFFDDCNMFEGHRYAYADPNYPDNLIEHLFNISCRHRSIANIINAKRIKEWRIPT